MLRSILLWVSGMAVAACAAEMSQLPAQPSSLAPATPTSQAAAPAATMPRKQSDAAAYAGHGRESVSQTLIARYAPKPLDPQVSRQVQAYLDVRAPGVGVTSPDGSRLFFTWQVTGTSQVWRLDGPQRFPVQLTGGQDSTTIADLTPDGQWLILSRDRNGEENPGIYLQRPAGGPLELVQHIAGVQTVFERVTDDSRYIYFRSNDIKPDSYAIYRYDLTRRARELVFSEPGLWFLADAQANGRLLLGKATGSLTSEYYEWDPTTRKLTPVIGVGENEEYAVVYGAHPGEFLVLTPKLGEFRRLYRLAAGTLTPVTSEMKMDVESFAIDRPRRRILVEVNDGGYRRLLGYDAKSYAKLALPPLPAADHVGFGATTHNGRFTTFAVETSRAPRASYVYAWQTRKLVQWLLPSAPEVDTSQFAEVKLEHYVARDGTSIPMFVRRPRTCAATPCPVIVEFHGGPESQSRPGFIPLYQLFVDAGFVLVQPNVRGSDGYGKSWLHADDGVKRLNVITDIEDCALFIKKQWAVNGPAPRVGVYGGSYGGYSVLMAMTRFAGAYDVGVSIVGISNLVTFLKNTAPYRRLLRTTEYGDPDKDHDALVKLSPVTYLSRIRSPLLIIQGATDPRVPVGEAVQIQQALESAKIPSELVIFADEGHGAQKRENRVIMFGRSLAFFKQHLLK